MIQILIAVTPGAFSIRIWRRPAVGLDNGAKNNVNWRLIYWRDALWLTMKCPSSHTLSPSISPSSYLFSTWLEISLSFCKFLDQYLSNCVLARNSKLSSDKRGQETESVCRPWQGEVAYLLWYWVLPAIFKCRFHLSLFVWHGTVKWLVWARFRWNDFVLQWSFSYDVLAFNKYWYCSFKLFLYGIISIALTLRPPQANREKY